MRQVADPQAASFVPGLAPDLEPGSPITIHNCPSLSVLEINFQSQLPLYLRSGIGKIQVQLCGLLFSLRTLPYSTIVFVLSPLCKVPPSTLVPAGGMQTYVTLQALLHSHSSSHRTASFISTLCDTSSFTFILCPEVTKDSQFLQNVAECKNLSRGPENGKL